MNRNVAGGMTLAVVVATAAVAGFWADSRMQDQSQADADSDPASAASGYGASTTIPDDAEPAIVERVVDGDTIRVIAEPGTSIPSGGSIRVRLLNIDAPERARDGRPGECGAVEATRRLEALLQPGQLVWLVADSEDRDQYDRPLRGAWTHDGLFVNEVLAREGHVETVLFEPNDRFHSRIVESVEVARAQQRGIWSELCPS